MKSKDCPIIETTATCIDESANENQSSNENQSAIKIEDSESSSTESSEFVDTDSAQIDLQTVQTIEIENILMERLLIPAIENTDKINVDNSIKELDFQQDESQMQIEYIDENLKDDQIASSQNPDISVDIERNKEMCQQKFNELKELLNDAHKIATSIVSSQEKLNTIDKGKEHDVSGIKIDDSSNRNNDTTIQRSVTPISNCSLDGDNRAGKYHKKPAPKAPLDTAATTNNENTNENESQNALKATLVIKTGMLRTVSNADATKDIFLPHTTDLKKKKKKSNRLRAKESFSKLLTIPKNIFHNAFHKDQGETSSKEDDSSSTFSETSESASRSDSIGSQVYVDASAKLSTSKQETDVEEISLKEEHDNIKSFYKDVNFFAEKSDTFIIPLNEADPNEIKNKIRDDTKNIKNLENYGNNLGSKSNLEIREMTQSLPHNSKTEIITDIN